MSKLNPIHHAYILNKKQKVFFDRFINIVAFIGPLAGVPQAIRVFETGAKDVSLLSWAGFTCFNILFLMYGLVYRLRPIIIGNLIWVLVEGSVVTGIIIDRVSH